MAKPTVSMEPGLAKSLEEFHAKVASAAEEVVFKIFPQKTLELQAFIDSTSSPSSEFHDSHSTSSTDARVYPDPTENVAPETKKRKRESDPANSVAHARYPDLVHTNELVQKVHEIVKKECNDLIQLCDKVKLWVTLTMPKIEDGDNFGVQIQEEALNELHRSQESAYSLRDASRLHHLSRAKICSKLIKYPNVEDYTLSLKEHDEKQIYLAKQHLYDLRNIYAIITDTLHKNITKIRVPKANNSVALY